MTHTTGTLSPPRRPSGALARFSEWSDRHFKWLLVAPAVVLILALSVYPLLFSVWVAFVNYDFQIPCHAFVGLKNFSQVVFDPVARWSLLLTIILSAINVTIEFGLGLALALAMVRTFPGRGLVMSILIVPLFISPVIVGQAWALMLQRPFGPTNYVLSVLTGHDVTISWLTETPWLYISLIVADVWQWTPFMFVILLAGLTSIPPNQYEAAELDGVDSWLAFRAITLPQLAPMILLAITFRLLDAIKLFDTIFIMTGGGPGTKTYTSSFYLYTVGLHPVPHRPGDGRGLDLPDLHGRGGQPAGQAPSQDGGRVMATPKWRRKGSFGRLVFLGLFLLFVLIPLYWMFITSIKPSDDYLAVPPVWFPKEPTIVHYTAALFAYRGMQGLINSLVISLAATALSALFGTMMAYSLARFGTGGKHLSFWVLSQRFLPPIAVVLPIFLIYRNFGLHDTHVGMIVAYTVFTLPVTVWMMFAYFRGLPRSMEDAALVDGCTRWQAFWRVAVPLAAPGIVAAAVFAFIAC